ncbi:unnamed protein product, partial [Durusdinium trenchii]
LIVTSAPGMSLKPMARHLRNMQVMAMRQMFRPSRYRLHPFAGAARSFAVAAKEPEYHTGGNFEGYHLFHRSAPFTFRNGEQIPELQIAYETWGHLNNKKDNVILLQCGMSASSHACSHARNPAPGWWEEYIGPGRPLDTNLFYVICTNNLGGCYGSSGPSAINSHTGQRYGSSFPRFEVQDQVAAQFVLLDHLGIDQVHACVGASLGGMQSVCAASMFPDRVRKFVSISACAKSFPGSIAFRHAQRQAIMSDPNWRGGDYYDGQLPANGLRLARQLGTITYRSGLEWQQRFGQSLAKGITKREGLKNEFMIENYLAHQGEKWVNAYDPNSLLWISKAMDGFSLEKPDRDGKPSLLEGLKEAMMPALVIGVQHDVLFPVWQQKEIADTLRKAGNKGVVYYELDSIYGHDSFLLDAVSIGPAVKGSGSWTFFLEDASGGHTRAVATCGRPSRTGVGEQRCWISSGHQPEGKHRRQHEGHFPSAGKWRKGGGARSAESHGEVGVVRSRQRGSC